MIEPTAEQQQAIDHRQGNLLIVACAGSGKTDTISRRIASLVAEGVPKDAIIAFTFTEHAASELKARIRGHLEDRVPNEPSIGDMYVGTIHSFCLRTLKELDPNYRNWEVMDEVRQAALIAVNFIRFDDSDRGIGLDRLRTETRTGTYWETVRRFTTTLDVMHHEGIAPEAIEDGRLRAAVERYRKLAHGLPNLSFDFNLIVDELIRFLENHPDKLSEVRTRFRHLVVDEYQDVDGRQERLIELISNRGKDVTVTAVGDDDQALYGFRGASVRNILDFERKYAPVERVIMGDNFRSSHAIVEVAYRAVQPVTNRLPKEMAARRRNPDGGLVERMADDGDIQLATFETEEDEARWVAERVETLRGTKFEQKDGRYRSLDYGDMAVLLRSVRSAGSEFARVLREHNIPVVISGTRGLFNNDEIRLVQAAFCLLARSDFAMPDEGGRIRIFDTVETREFVRKTVERLSRDRMRTANSTAFLEWTSRTLEELGRRSLPKEKRGGRLARRIYPQDIFQGMLGALGSGKGDWSRDVLFNLGAFSGLLTQFESVHQWITPANLRGLTLFLGNWAASNADEGGLDDVVRMNSVQIMTVHAAKGLEWPVVFLPRISSSTFPSSRRNHGPETFLPTSQFDPATYAGGNDGERRLWYVALTRCAKFLNVSSLDRSRKRPTEYFREIQHPVVRRNGDDPTPRQRGEPQPPAEAGMLPTTYSDLAYWWRCPKEYELRSLMGFRPGVSEQYGYGQQLHNILAQIHEKARHGDVPTEQEVKHLVERRFHLRYTQGRPLDALRDAARDALVRYVREQGDLLTRTRAIEKPFEFIEPNSGALITGMVDLLERADSDDEGNGVREPVGIVDFKAHKIATREDYEDLREKAEQQLRLYAEAVRYAFPFEPATAAVQLITPRELLPELKAQGYGDRITVDVSKEGRETVMQMVSDAVGGIRESLERQEFPHLGARSGVCRRCDFRLFCPGYEEWRAENRNAPTPRTPAEERDVETDTIIEEQNAGT